MRRNRAEIQVFSISFLDVLSCALGAVLILLIVVPTSPPKPEVSQKIIQMLKAAVTSMTTENKSLEEQINEVKEENKKLRQEESKTIPQPAKQPTPSLFWASTYSRPCRICYRCFWQYELARLQFISNNRITFDELRG